MKRAVGVTLLVLAQATASVLHASAQNVEVFASQEQRTPRFLYAANSKAEPVAIDPGTAPVLRDRISVSFEDVPLRKALDIISRESGLRLFYSKDVLSLDTRVRLRAEDITVAAALTEVLLDSGVDVLLGPKGKAALVKRKAVAFPEVQEVGTVTGRVTNAETGEPVVNAQVVVEGTGRGTSADEDGRFRIVNVPAGRHTVAVTSIGYARSTREVEVADGATINVDFALEVSPTALNELVVTVTGQQRKVELGHVVGRIKVDSLVREAPISTVSELLTGRVAGVQVAQQQGTVGGQVALQVRGRNSIRLSNEPIVVVDGVRYTTATPPANGGLIAGEFTSPLNDINPNDIESIDVVKGPAAATLYGTDAANGVIAITTKRGRPGAPRWSAYAKAAQTFIPAQRYPDRYRAYGTTTAGTLTSSCQLIYVAAGACSQDSVVVSPNPLNDPELSIFGKQPLWEAGINVSGGSEDLRYYLSAGFQDATGPVQMPPAMVELLESNRGARIPEEWRKPNTRRNVNLRANITAQLGAADLSVQAGYIRDATRSFPVDNPYTGVWEEGTETSPYGSRRPEEYFAGQSTEQTDRFIGAANAQWRLASWLNARGAVGLDVAARNRNSLLRQGDAPNRGFANGGFANDSRTRQVSTTGDLGLNATARHGRFTLRTSAGAQYVRSLTDALTSFGFGLPPGGSSVAQTGTKFSGHSYSETVTLGGYLEETVGVNDRLFLTGAVRVDGASTFGRNYDAAVYPRAGASWLVSEESFFPRVPGLDELRLRYAFGAAGQQPLPDWSRPTYSVRPGWIDEALQDAISLRTLGNPDLRPERVREHEFGFDAAALDGRVQLGLTWNRRRTIDQIASVPIAAGYGSRFTNLGLTTQHGFEAELTANLLSTRWVSLDVKATHASHRTKLVDLGDASENRNPVNGYAEGYSLGARFLPKISYQDADGDGLLAESEVQVSLDEREYVGESVPPISQAFSAVLGLDNRRVRVSALLERRAGFMQSNQLKTAACIQLRCLETMDPSTPLDVQAMMVAGFRHTPADLAFLERGDFIRLRELTVSVDLPRLFNRSATVTLSGRNLALWTRFKGPDVESQSMGNGAFASDAGAIPQGQTWAVRFDVGY